MPTYPTPTEIRSGETRPFPYDWTKRLTEVGATSIVGSAWERVSGTVTLGTESTGTTTTAVQVTGGTADTDSVISNSIIVNTGAVLVETFHLFSTVGDRDGDLTTPLVYYGVGVAGRTSLVGLTSVSDPNLPFSFTVSPAGQKVYAAVPVGYGTPAMYFGPYPVACTSSVVSGCTLLESVDLHTWTDLVVTIARAA